MSRVDASGRQRTGLHGYLGPAVEVLEGANRAADGQGQSDAAAIIGLGQPDAEVRRSILRGDGVKDDVAISTWDLIADQYPFHRQRCAFAPYCSLGRLAHNVGVATAA